MPIENYIFNSNIEEEKKSKEIVAGKPNWMIESNHGFKDVHEYRLFLAMLYKAYDGVDISKPFEVDISFIISGRGGEEYKYLKDACKNIMSRVINLVSEENKNEFEYRQMVYKASYKKYSGTGKLKVAFHPDVIPYIYAMFKEGKYTKIFLKHALPIRSLYSVRLYEILLQYKNFGKREMSIDDLRFCLDIPAEKFKQWAHLKQKILIPAQTNLEKYTDIKFDFLAVKNGIKITDVNFSIFPNIPSYDGIQTELFEENVENELIQNNDHKMPKHVNIIRENLWPDSQEEALKSFTPDRILHYYAYAKQAERNGQIKGGFKGFFYVSLFEDRDNYEFQKNKKEKILQSEEKKNVNSSIKNQEAEEEEYNRKYLEGKEKFYQLSEAEQLKYLEKIPKVMSQQTRIDAAISLFAGIK